MIYGISGDYWGLSLDSDNSPLFLRFQVFDAVKIEKESAELILDDDVTKKSGIYSYILTRDEKYLSIRAFSQAQRQKAYLRQKGVCSKCEKRFEIGEMDADHIKPWSKGGQTVQENRQMLCKDCNRAKSGK